MIYYGIAFGLTCSLFFAALCKMTSLWKDTGPAVVFFFSVIWFWLSLCHFMYMGESHGATGMFGVASMYLTLMIAGVVFAIYDRREKQGDD